MTIDERIAECDRLERGQRAEGVGLRAAKLGQGYLAYSRDPYLQERFAQGYRDGLSLLIVAEGTQPVVSGVS